MSRTWLSWALAGAALLCARGAAVAESPEAGTGTGSESGTGTGTEADTVAEAEAETAPGTEAETEPGTDEPEPDETIFVVGDPVPLLAGRASSRVSRHDLDERQPRSAPDALRWEPGVYVQQTSAAQGSAYLRGRTGQQTLLLFDGIRLNNSLWRQGPNQYFFTVDTRTLGAIDVVRGGASTRFGSDAIGGVLHAAPREAAPGPRGLAPRVELRYGSADHEVGGRAELAARPWAGGALLAGIGYRDASLLESAGPVPGVTDDTPALVPRFGADGRTQLGTGFTEATWDARLVQRWGATRLTAAYYDYRQYDAPRTDQCPAAFAPALECLVYDEQFHQLAYLAADRDLGRWARAARIVVSAPEQHERKRRERPSAMAEDAGRDDVRTVGLAASATAELTDPLADAVAPQIVLDYGADLYADFVDSVAWLRFTDVDFIRFDSRGQYVSGSRYQTGGGFAQAAARWSRLTLRGGGRLGVAAAHAPGDDASATTPIDRAWLTSAAVLGLEAPLGHGVELLANLDRSFRAPNLDDLTGRQAAGPGFQFENAALAAEAAHTAEVGARLRGARGGVEAWAFASRLDGAIVRSLRSIDECPPASPQCQASWFRYQLVNVDGALLVGAEAAAEYATARWAARATVSYARGDGPNPQEPPSDPALPYEEEVALSRVPPLHGTVELTAPWAWGYASAGLRWAGTQDRLAPADLSDPRIPPGGTPGYAVVDLRAGARLSTHARAGVVVENVLDAAYRYHGSSINGPGRSALIWVEMTP